MSEADSVRPLFGVVGGATTKAAWMRPQKPEVRGLSFAQWNSGEATAASPLIGATLRGTGQTAHVRPEPAPEPPTLSPVEERIEALEAERAALAEERGALEATRAELNAQRERLAEAAGELGLAQSRALNEARETLIDLAVGVAEVIVGQALERDAGVHEELARVALATLGEAAGVELRGSPRAYELLVEVLGTPEVSYRGARVPVLKDETVEGLGFVATSGRTRVDGTVSERLSAVHDALLHELRVSPPSDLKEEPEA